MIRRDSEAWHQAKEAWVYFVDQGKQPTAGAVDRRALYIAHKSSHPFVMCADCQYGGKPDTKCLQGQTIRAATHECHRYTPKPHMGRNKELLKFVGRMIEKKWM